MSYMPLRIIIGKTVLGVVPPQISAHPQPNHSGIAVRGTLQAVLLERAPRLTRALRLVNILAAA